jgi:flagellar biosynthesis protein FlhG
MAKLLAQDGYKVLLVDCDTNLSNTSVKLGIPLKDDFYALVTAQKNFDECLYKEGNFHLLAACNGDLSLFDSKLEIDKIILDIVAAHEADYDVILLDSPAGLTREALTINAYSDFRMVVVTPDKASITDSYSLIKVLKNRYGVNENHLVLNKISSAPQYQRLVGAFIETVDRFLQCRTHVLGSLSFVDQSVDRFDRMLLKDAGSELSKDFNKILKRFTEENLGVSEPSFEDVQAPLLPISARQDVRPTIS